ncbi:unnamed protein product, partial [Amoebophrya sp. A25]
APLLPACCRYRNGFFFQLEAEKRMEQQKLLAHRKRRRLERQRRERHVRDYCAVVTHALQGTVTRVLCAALWRWRNAAAAMPRKARSKAPSPNTDATTLAKGGDQMDVEHAGSDLDVDSS